jgi:hypothetical protein
VVVSREQFLLQVDAAYYTILKARSELTVAQEAVKERQTVADQIARLQQNQLRSGLDVTFAKVNLAQAQLLLIQAQNDLLSSFARMSAALGYSDVRTYQLADEPVPSAPPPNVADLIQQALRDRPELLGQQFDLGSAQSYATAERDLNLPTISAVGTAGLTPVNESTPLLPLRSRGIQRKHPALQWAPFWRVTQRGQFAGASRRSEPARFAGPGRPRCPDGVAQRQFRVSKAVGHSTIARSGKPIAQPRAVTISTRAEFHRRTEPGAIEPDASRNRPCER